MTTQKQFLEVGKWAAVVGCAILSFASPAMTETAPKPDGALHIAARSMALDGGEDIHGSFLLRLKPAISEAARLRELRPSLLLALIKNSSGFDPGAELANGAIGLLPLKPDGPGRLANRLVRGADTPPSEDTLFDPEASLVLGSAYIQHLDQSVFGDVEDNTSRLLLTVAAYFHGIPAVARAFDVGSDVSKAVRFINRSSPTKVRLRLMRRQENDDARKLIAAVIDDIRRWEGAVLARSLNRRLGIGRPSREAPAPTETPNELAALPPASEEDGVMRPRRKPTSPDLPQFASLTLEQLRRPVLVNARRYGIAPSLILSVMKNESAFNSKAESSAGALGLMQLMPETGGRDALSYLKGKESIPTDATLYHPETNIELGATYLHLLSNKHLGKVRHEDSRRFAVIASYHAGIGTVARVFTGSRKIAPLVEALNKLTPDQVYTTLMKRLPAMESKSYLLNVNRDLPRFSDWDDLG